MTKNSNRVSILQGNFCDIVNYFRGRKCDQVDLLAQRALTIIFLTDHLVQTGCEIDTDPYCANMFASRALGSINSIKRYSWVRVTEHGSEIVLCEADDSWEEMDALLDSAEEMIEMAEGLMKKVEPPAIYLTSVHMATRRLVALTDGFRS